MRLQRLAVLVLSSLPAASPWTSDPGAARSCAAEQEKPLAHGYDFFELSRYPLEGEDFVAPGVVLRLANGRKRVLHRWLLCEEDQRFAMDLYVNEMKRIKASLDQTEFTSRGQSAAPGRQLYTSPHFVFSVTAHPAGEDPNWCYCAVTSMPKADVEQNFFQTLARLAEQRGMCRNGVRGAGDIVAEYGARLAEFDFQNNDVLKTSWSAVAKNYLEAMDVEKGVYRIVWDEAPEPYGTNIVRLVADPDSKEIAVDFQGYHDPTT